MLSGPGWPAHLPWILLGLRAALKEDHNVSVAELLYGVPLGLPGELLDTAKPPATNFLEHLHWAPTSLPTRPLTGPLPALVPPQALATAGFVFIRRGTPGPSLSPLYDRLYCMLFPGPKVFTLELSGRQERVSVDRLKPCLAT